MRILIEMLEDYIDDEKSLNKEEIALCNKILHKLINISNKAILNNKIINFNTIEDITEGDYFVIKNMIEDWEFVCKNQDNIIELPIVKFNNNCSICNKADKTFYKITYKNLPKSSNNNQLMVCKNCLEIIDPMGRFNTEIYFIEEALEYAKKIDEEIKSYTTNEPLIKFLDFVINMNYKNLTTDRKQFNIWKKTTYLMFIKYLYALKHNEITDEMLSILNAFPKNCQFMLKENLYVPNIKLIHNNNLSYCNKYEFMLGMIKSYKIDSSNIENVYNILYDIFIKTVDLLKYGRPYTISKGKSSIAALITNAKSINENHDIFTELCALFLTVDCNYIKDIKFYPERKTDIPLKSYYKDFMDILYKESLNHNTDNKNKFNEYILKLYEQTTEFKSVKESEELLKNVPKKRNYNRHKQKSAYIG